MAQAEAVDSILQWLEALRYPHERSEDLAGLVVGDFGASLLWLSQHAVGRRQAAHIKTELHRLREEASTKLSAPRCAELGLDVWTTAIKEAGKLQAEDSRTAELLQGALRDQAEAERYHSASVDELMRRKVLLTALADLEATTTKQQARISALTALVDEWTAESRLKLEGSSASQDVAKTRQLLREAGDELALESMATPAYLDELADMLLKIKSQLQDHVERHQAIRPPPIDNAEEQLFTLQQHCLDLSRPPSFSLAPPRPPKDDRGRLLQALAEARARRNALRDETAKLRAEPSPPPVYDEAIREAQDRVTSQQHRVEELLQLRADILSRIADDAEQACTPFATMLADLDAAAAAASSSLDSAKAAELASYSASSAAKSCPQEPLELLSPLKADVQLAREARRALQTAHLLDSTVPLAASTPSDAIDRACDSIAHSRFTLEALRPSLAGQLDSPVSSRAAELDELVRLRIFLSDGKLLPPTKGADGKSVAERWRRGERELAKEGKAAKVKESRR
ncbi:hypothetical protein BCR35DRAFT_348912 [Leucosporidium creatinivorum]|uniref:Uncharacterized protein n=1 Tax=Leucosporidium creatinivorum TaxID=106004 RepID=A0A1Y2G3K2_9BASI|nr:hypothetical protein BCR35DRAFT_348912 [Leucosporidium creatinivorum]